VAVPHLQGRGGQQGRVKGGGTDMSRDLQPPMANPDGRTAATGRETHVICVKAENSCVQEAMGGGGAEREGEVRKAAGSGRRVGSGGSELGRQVTHG
jgi:hypothetical protein